MYALHILVSEQCYWNRKTFILGSSLFFLVNQLFYHFGYLCFLKIKKEQFCHGRWPIGIDPIPAILGGNWTSTMQTLGEPFCGFPVNWSLFFVRFFPALLSDEGMGPSECRSNAIINASGLHIPNVSFFSLFLFLLLLLLMLQRDQRQPGAAIVVISRKWRLMKELFLLITAVSPSRQSRVICRFAFFFSFLKIPLFLLPLSQQHPPPPLLAPSQTFSLVRVIPKHFSFHLIREWRRTRTEDIKVSLLYLN